MRAETGRNAPLVHERLVREARRRLVLRRRARAKVCRANWALKDPAAFCRFFKRRTGPRDTERARAVRAGRRLIATACHRLEVIPPAASWWADPAGAQVAQISVHGMRGGEGTGAQP